MLVIGGFLIFLLVNFYCFYLVQTVLTPNKFEKGMQDNAWGNLNHEAKVQSKMFE